MSDYSTTSYVFPTHRLKKPSGDPSKTPAVFVFCGSFSPITNQHLRVFELARDHAKYSTNFEILGGYLSPVSDAYGKTGLASSVHRQAMCHLAVHHDSDWLMLDPWESRQSTYTPTAALLDHFAASLPGVAIILLAGADLVATMANPALWTGAELDHIFGRYRLFVVERSGTDLDDALAGLGEWRGRGRIESVGEVVGHEGSSTKIRLCLRKGLSVRYLVPKEVIEYIEEHGLYCE